MSAAQFADIIEDYIDAEEYRIFEHITDLLKYTDAEQSEWATQEALMAMVRENNVRFLRSQLKRFV